MIADAHREDDAYGAEHPGHLATRANLARWTGEAGDPAAARDQFAALLPALERVLGQEHPHTLTARHKLASLTGQAGDPAAVLLAGRPGNRNRIPGQLRCHGAQCLTQPPQQSTQPATAYLAP